MLKIIGPDNITDAILEYARNEVLQLARNFHALCASAEDVGADYRREAINFKRRVRRYTKKQGVEDLMWEEMCYNFLDFMPGLTFEVVRLDPDNKGALTAEQRARILGLERDYVNRLMHLEEKVKKIKKDNRTIYFEMLERTIVQKLFGYIKEYPLALLCIRHSEDERVAVVQADFMDMKIEPRKDVPISRMPVSQCAADKLEEIARLEYMNVYTVQHHTTGFSWEEMAAHVVERFHERYAKDGGRLKKERVQKLLDNAFHAMLIDERNTDIVNIGYKKIK